METARIDGALVVEAGKLLRRAARTFDPKTIWTQDGLTGERRIIAKDFLSSAAKRDVDRAMEAVGRFMAPGHHAACQRLMAIRLGDPPDPARHAALDLETLPLEALEVFDSPVHDDDRDAWKLGESARTAILDVMHKAGTFDELRRRLRDAGEDLIHVGSEMTMAPAAPVAPAGDAGDVTGMTATLVAPAKLVALSPGAIGILRLLDRTLTHWTVERLSNLGNTDPLRKQIPRSREKVSECIKELVKQGFADYGSASSTRHSRSGVGCTDSGQQRLQVIDAGAKGAR